MAFTNIDTHVHGKEIWRGWVTERVGHTSAEAVIKAAQKRDKAIRKGLPRDQVLGGIAVTNHDTFKGIGAALEAGEEHGLTVIAGVEVTCRPTTRGATGPHMLVYVPAEEARRLEEKRGRKK